MHRSANAGSCTIKTVVLATTVAIPTHPVTVAAQPASTMWNNAKAVSGGMTIRRISFPDLSSHKKRAADKVCSPVSIAYQLVIGVGNHCLVLSELLFVNRSLFNQLNDFRLQLAATLGQLFQIDK